MKGRKNVKGRSAHGATAQRQHHHADQRDVTIRRFREGDLEACRDLGNTQFDFREYLRLPGYRFLVAESEGVIVGFGAVHVWDWNRSAWVSETMVAPAHRRQGVGRALFQELMREAKDAGSRVLVDYIPPDSEFLGFYFRLGLRVIGYHSSFFDHADPLRQDALIVGCELL